MLLIWLFFSWGSDVGALQCEKLGEETGCWILLAGHAGTSETHAVHYSSKALRRDAISDATDLAKSFMATTGRLKNAKFHNADELARKLAEKEAELEALRIQLEVAAIDFEGTAK